MSTIDEEVAGITSSVNLIDVRLQQADVLTLIRDLGLIKNPRLVFKYSTNVADRSEIAFMVLAMMHAAVAGDDVDPNTSESPVTMRITFALSYSLPNAMSYSEQAMGEFARFNAAFNAWSFWREYIHSTAARMQLPSLVLPTFRVLRANPQVAEKAEAQAEPIREAHSKTAEPAKGRDSARRSRRRKS